MKEQTKTIRVRVTRPFYLTRDRVAVVGEELDLSTAEGMAAVHGGKAVKITESHTTVPTPAPAADPFLKPDAEKRGASKKEKAK